MSPDQLTECMHAVLDGRATPEQSRALDAVLATDAQAVEEFESWKVMFDAMHSLPAANPPEGLVASISAQIPRDIGTLATGPEKEESSVHGQLFPSQSVLGSGQTRSSRLSSGLRTVFRRPDRSESTQGYGQMNANRKIWAGGAIAVVALGVAIFASGYPPKPENVTGTVVPAERYRATQSGVEAVKLGEQSTAPTSAKATDAGAPLAGKSEAQMQADRAVQKSDAQMQADRAVQKTDAQMQADRAMQKSDAQMQADRAMQKTDAQMQADRAMQKSDAQMQADRTRSQRSDAQMQADRAMQKSDAQMQADRTRAAQSDAQMQADRMRSQRTDAQMQADRAATQKADAQAKAEKASSN